MDQSEASSNSALEILTVFNDTHPRTDDQIKRNHLKFIKSDTSDAETLTKCYDQAILNMQDSFLDQNFNSEQENDLRLNWEEHEDGDEKGNWGSWSPDTEKYWTLQYSELEKKGEELQKQNEECVPSVSDTILVLVEEESEKKNQEIAKKSHGQYSSGGTDPPKKDPPDKNRFLRQVTFWICSTALQPMVEEYDDPKIRASFTTKVLLLKTFQLLIMLGAIVGLTHSTLLQQFHQHCAFLVYTAMVVYTILVLSLKANLVGISRTGASVCMLVQTLCLTEISAAIASNSDALIVLTVFMVLSITYIILAVLCGSMNLDIINNNNIFTLTSCLVLVTTIGILGTLFYYSSSAAAYSTSKKIGSLFVPVVLTSETIVLLTLSELYQILQGYRIPLVKTESDWIQATAQLF